MVDSGVQWKMDAFELFDHENSKQHALDIPIALENGLVQNGIKGSEEAYI